MKDGFNLDDLMNTITTAVGYGINFVKSIVKIVRMFK